jgi:TPR repeat protein
MSRPQPLDSGSTIYWDKEPDLDGFRRAWAIQQTDPRQGLHELEALAGCGSVASMIHVGYAYQEGNGVPPDTEKAEDWYRRASDAGSIDGSFRLGCLYRMSHRFDEALAAYSIGESQNFPPSIYWMGRMYLNGMGVDPNHDKAMDFWRRASALGHPYAARNLAFDHLNGRYGLRGFVRGLVMWLAAMRDGIAIALRNPRSDLLM